MSEELLTDETVIWWCENQQWATTIPEGDDLLSCGYSCGPMKFEHLPKWAKERLVAAVGEEEQ